MTTPDYDTDFDARTQGRPVARRLSRLQRRILAWLAAEAQRTRGTMDLW